MIKKRFFVKIFSGYFLAAIILPLLIALFTVSIIRSHYLETLGAGLKAETIILETKTGEFLRKADYKGLRDYIGIIRKDISARITVVDRDGIVIADSDSDYRSMENHIYRPEIAAAFSGLTETVIRYSESTGTEMLYCAMPVKDENGAAAWALRTSYYVSGVNALINSLLSRIGAVTILIVVLSLVAAFFIARRIYLPVKRLAAASREMASGNFGARVVIHEKNELKDLADAFNELGAEIGKLIAELTEKNTQINTIVSSIAEGLIVVDEKGSVILVNSSFKKIAGTDCAGSGFYWECFMPPGFNGVLESALKKKKNCIEQLEINSRVYLCSATYMENSGHAAMIMYDITEFKELERIKKDFVANVSHELKTPLTAIKGFAETLEPEVKTADAKRYLEIIKNNTERLINIVSDLLTLSELEQPDVVFNGEEADIEAVIKDVARIFEAAAKKKGLYVKTSFEPGMGRIKGDTFRLEQALVNIIGNAVKYTDSGGVEISAANAEGGIEIKISDTGCGIPEGGLERVFERFYVVDKSRSRKLGGTGLGLSIAKHIIQLHKGFIKAESEKGKGSVFTIFLPK